MSNNILDKIPIDTKNKIEALIIEFSKDADLINTVQKIEGSIATTQNHYGNYMNFLSYFNNNKVMLYIISQALKLIGADVIGVNNAVKILIG